MSFPPWGGIRWLVEVNWVNLLGSMFFQLRVRAGNGVQATTTTLRCCGFARTGKKRSTASSGRMESADCGSSNAIPWTGWVVHAKHLLSIYLEIPRRFQSFVHK